MTFKFMAKVLIRFQSWIDNARMYPFEADSCAGSCGHGRKPDGVWQESGG
jgi:hypothetical protein